MKREKQAFNRRAFVSYGMVTSLLFLPISGIMNHELQTDPLTAARHLWMAIHNMTAILFTIFTLVHLAYNWRPLLRYVRTLPTKRPSRESLFAIATVVMLVGIFSLHALHTR